MEKQFLLTTIVSALLAATPSVSSAPIEQNQIEVVGGDTIRVGGDTFRLVGFNTPEPGRNAKCEAERALAARATFHLRQLVSSGNLDLERVPCACRPNTEGTQACNHSRSCAVLKVRDKDVAETMVAEGLAEKYVCGKVSCPTRRGWCP